MILAIPSDATKTEMPVGVIYHVVHPIPGRVRFWILLLANDPNYALRLQKLLKSDSQITEIRVNKHANSIAIAYQQIGKSDI